MLFVGFVDKQLSISIEEEEGISVFFLHDPTTAVLSVNFHFAVFAAYLLFGKEFVVLVVDLDIGVSVSFVDKSVHVVAIDSVSDEVHLVVFSGVLSYQNHVGHVIVIPIAVAVDPEARPMPVVIAAGIPVELVAVHHAVVMGMVEVGSGVHGTM